MDCAQWIHDVSAVTANAQLTGCSTRSHPQPSRRDLTPDGSESSCPLNESDSGPTDEEVGLEANSLESPGPDDLDEPWPYTFRVSQSHSAGVWSLMIVFRWETVYGYEQRKGTGIRAKCRAIMSSEGRLDRYWISLWTG